MKILELTNYSSGICGVWQRVKQESLELSKLGHEVEVFSSNRVKGSDKIASKRGSIQNIKITRFSAKKVGGESFLSWKFKKEAIKYKPDIIMVHSYRHLHTTRALDIAKKINAKVFLVTHAPFDRSNTRSFSANSIVYIYDKVIGPFMLKKFDKIITIAKWESAYLKKLGVIENKISYIPNGIPEEFFTSTKSEEKDKILFLGRVSPIKDLETLIEAMSLIDNKKIKLEIVGPAEENYLKKLKNKIAKLNIKERIVFSKGIYEIKEKIKKIDSAKIFVLPSKSEGMSQGLIEAMAREKIVLASDNKAARELIQNQKNGFLFEVGSVENLVERINVLLNRDDLKKVKENAKKSVEKFNWSSIVKKIEELF